MATRSWEEVRDLLRQWREENVRRSEEIVDFWLTLLSKHVNKLGDEKWLVYEQVCIAALDCHNFTLVQECLRTLERQFPGSMRVRKLRAMKYEALERYEEAMKLYDSILQMDEANSVIYKRKIALLKAQNRILDAIKELTEYLKKFMSDQEAWMELCSLYIEEQDYNKAGFCMEELILSNPHNHLYHQRYAEIQYTIGGPEGMKLARSYFAQAVKLNPHNMRALFGLFLSASNSAVSAKTTAQKKKESLKYATWAAVQINGKYQEQLCDDSQLKTVENMLTSLQIT